MEGGGEGRRNVREGERERKEEGEGERGRDGGRRGERERWREKGTEGEMEGRRGGGERGGEGGKHMCSMSEESSQRCRLWSWRSGARPPCAPQRPLQLLLLVVRLNLGVCQVGEVCGGGDGDGVEGVLRHGGLGAAGGLGGHQHHGGVGGGRMVGLDHP